MAAINLPPPQLLPVPPAIERKADDPSIGLAKSALPAGVEFRNADKPTFFCTTPNQTSPLNTAAPSAPVPAPTQAAPTPAPAVTPAAELPPHFDSPVKLQIQNNTGQILLKNVNGITCFHFKDAAGQNSYFPVTDNFEADYTNRNITPKAFTLITKYQARNGINHEVAPATAPAVTPAAPNPSAAPAAAPAAPAPAPSTGAVITGPTGTYAVTPATPGQNQVVTIRQGREYTEPQLTAQEIRNQVSASNAKVTIARNNYNLSAMSFAVDRESGLPIIIKENGVIPESAGGGTSPDARKGFYVAYKDGVQHFIPPSEEAILKANESARLIAASEKKRAQTDNTWAGRSEELAKKKAEAAAAKTADVATNALLKRLEEALNGKKE